MPIEIAMVLVMIVLGFVGSIALLRYFTRRIGAHVAARDASVAKGSSSDHHADIEPPILGRVTIQRGSDIAELGVVSAAFTLVKHGAERVLVYYVQANGALDRQPIVDVDGNPHPGATISVYQWFDPNFVDEPPMRIVVRDLEDPIHDVTPRAGVPASTLFDYEISTIVRFKMRFNHEKASHAEPWLDCEARTAGGPQGDPAPFRISIQSKFQWISPMNLGDSGWSEIRSKMTQVATRQRNGITPIND